MSAIGQAIAKCGPSKLAARWKCSAQAVCFWRDGERQMPVEHMADLEAQCGFAYRRWDFRPNDWHLIWPELVGAEGAPRIDSEVDALN